MSATPTLYAINPGPGRDQLSLETLWTQDGDGPLASGYSQMFSLRMKDQLYLVGVAADGSATAFSVQSRAPWLVPAESKLDLGGPWDIIEPFVIGNQQHLLAYGSKSGQFSFIPIGHGLTSEPPYHYQRNHAPGTTAGFDVAYPITIFGMVYYLCYSFSTGTVAIYSLSVTATSPAGAPPLVSNYVWLHQWARSWTRFAFFQLGGENFFFKINVGPKPNVNIDHVQDDPTQGTVEVGSNLHLDDSGKIDITRTFYLGNGDPYLITYVKDGSTTFNRFNGNCRGWTTEASLKTVEGATQVVPLQLGDRCLVLFC